MDCGYCEGDLYAIRYRHTHDDKQRMSLEVQCLHSEYTIHLYESFCHPETPWKKYLAKLVHNSISSTNKSVSNMDLILCLATPEIGADLPVEVQNLILNHVSIQAKIARIVRSKDNTSYQIQNLLSRNFFNMLDFREK